MIRLLKPALVAFFAVLLAWVPGVAQAHDELLSTDPADGATVDVLQELTLTFSGDIAEVGAQLVITAPDGTEVADGDPQVRGTDLVQPLSDVVPGDYEVVWRVTSSDGHPISGTFAFTVQDDGQDDRASQDEGAIGDGEEGATEDTGSQDEAGDEATEDGGTDPDATDTGAGDTTGEDATPAPTTDASSTQDSSQGGLPVWIWVVLGAVVLGLVALLARTWSRGRQ